jgi:hypothetical protein
LETGSGEGDSVGVRVTVGDREIVGEVTTLSGGVGVIVAISGVMLRIRTSSNLAIGVGVSEIGGLMMRGIRMTSKVKMIRLPTQSSHFGKV